MPEPKDLKGLSEVLTIHLVFIAITSISPDSLDINVDALHLIYTSIGISL